MKERAHRSILIDMQYTAKNIPKCRMWESDVERGKMEV